MKLWQIFYYNFCGERDFCLVVIDEKKDIQKQLFAFLKKENLKPIDVDMFPIYSEYDCKGKEYIINLRLRK